MFAEFRFLICRETIVLASLLVWPSPTTRVCAQSSNPAVAQNGISEAQVRESLYRGLDWLKGQQADSGGWHSQTYGQMQTGAGTTALIAFALSNLDDEARQRFGEPQWHQALNFLLSSLDKQGFVRASAEATDYPTYSTALTLLAIKQLENPKLSDMRSNMVRYLVNAQRTEAQGVSAADPQYGAWDQTGGPDAAKQRYGQVDIAVSSAVLQALKGEAGVDEKVFERAIVFLNRCHLNNADGGFFFTTAKEDPRNKAGSDSTPGQSERPRSYATTTVDAVNCMLACGVAADDVRVRGCVQWLVQHPQVDVVPGFIDEESRRTWGVGLRYYYWAGISRVLHLLPKEERDLRRQTLLRQLLSSQREDGSWQNESHAMREDDPLIATAFAVLALGHLTEAHSSNQTLDR